MDCQSRAEIGTKAIGRPVLFHCGGWGVARYATPEYLLGREMVQSAYFRSPKESKERILAYLSNLLPDADKGQLLKIIG